MAYWMLECFHAESGPGRAMGRPPRVPGVDSWILGEPLPVRPPEPIVLTWHPEETEGRPKHLYKSGVPVMTPRLHDELQAAGVDNLEVFLAEVRDEVEGTANTYLAFNVVGAIAAADMSLSKYQTGGGPAMYAVDFESVVLDEERIKDALLFRLAQNLTAIVISDRVKERLERAALGLTFIPPEEWVG